MSHDPAATKLADDRDALGFNVQDACEEPLMRVQQSANVLCVLHDRLFREDPTAADAVALATGSLHCAVQELRKALRFSNPNPRRTA